MFFKHRDFATSKQSTQELTSSMVSCENVCMQNSAETLSAAAHDLIAAIPGSPTFRVPSERMLKPSRSVFEEMDEGWDGVTTPRLPTGAGSN